MSQLTITYVLNARWPTIKAYGLQVAKTCQGLKQAGAKVRLVVPIRARHQEIAGVDPFTLYGIQDRFRVIRLPSLDFTRLHLTGRVFFLIQQTLFAFMVACALVFRRGAVYSRDPFTAYALTFVRRDVFWEAHRLPGNPDSRMYRRLMQHTAGIVVISHGLRDQFLQHGTPAGRITVIADAADPTEFAIPQTPTEARAELSLPADGKILGYVGQLTTLGKEKGVGNLLSAFALLMNHHSAVWLVIVGGNAEDEAHYRSQADTLGDAGKKVIWAGHQQYHRIPTYLRAMDVLVMPFPNTEHYARFMSPLKLFEYLAARKPIVATDLPSVREVVSDDEVFFVRAGEPQEMADGMETALTDNTLVARKLEAVDRLLPHHSWRARGESIIDFLAVQGAH